MAIQKVFRLMGKDEPKSSMLVKAITDWLADANGTTNSLLLSLNTVKSRAASSTSIEPKTSSKKDADQSEVSTVCLCFFLLYS